MLSTWYKANGHKAENLFVDYTSTRLASCCICGIQKEEMPGLSDKTCDYTHRTGRIDRICSEECLEYLKLEIC